MSNCCLFKVSCNWFTTFILQHCLYDRANVSNTEYWSTRRARCSACQPALWPILLLTWGKPFSNTSHAPHRPTQAWHALRCLRLGLSWIIILSVSFYHLKDLMISNIDTRLTLGSAGSRSQSFCSLTSLGAYRHPIHSWAGWLGDHLSFCST